MIRIARIVLTTIALVPSALALTPAPATRQLGPMPKSCWLIGPDLAVGGQPSNDDLELLQKSGIKTILNIRSDEESGVVEEEAAVAKLAVQYVQVSVDVDSVDAATVAAFRKVVNEPKNRPLLVHCRSSNRVGMMLAVLAAVDDGKSLAEAEQLGVAAGLKSDDAKAKFRDLAVTLGAKR